MNAVLREKYGVPMLTIEAIEVHLESLHNGQNELREDVRELRADNKSLRDKVDALDRKIDAVDKNLSDKINAVEGTLGDKISLLSESVAGMRGMQKAMLWVMSGLGSLGIVGKILHWF
jgi:chromosome segregation ATPase